MPTSWIDTYTLSCAAGIGIAAVRESIATGRTGLRADPWLPVNLTTWLGHIAELDDIKWPAELARWDSRNNRLAWLGVRQDGFERRLAEVVTRLGPGRVGLIVGTSTSSIGRTEEAYATLTPEGKFSADFRQPDVHNPHSTGVFLAHYLGIQGPAITISTACSSSAKVLASADRWLSCGIADAVVVAGVDSLCRSTVYGFESLQLVSRGLCRPFDARRDGLNIGEAAAFALVMREPLGRPRVRFLGYGESCDAFHMSSPHPEGLGARLALERAFARAGVAAPAVGYVNLHGTGTRTNDAIESIAMAKVFPWGVPASSTKGWTGHTLGAAGLVEAVLAMDTFDTGVLPANLNLETQGADVAHPVLGANRRAHVDVAVSSSFGFGGNNCVLVFGRADG